MIEEHFSGNQEIAEPGSEAPPRAGHVLRDIVAYGLSLAIPGFVALMSAPVLTRVTTRDGYAQYILALSLISAGTAVNSWINMSVIRFFPVAERNGQGKQFFRVAVRLATGSAAVIALAGAALIASLRHLVPRGLTPLLLLSCGVFVVVEAGNALLSIARIRSLKREYLRYNTWKAAVGFAIGLSAATIFRLGPAGLVLGVGMAVACALPWMWRRCGAFASGVQNHSPGETSVVDVRLSDMLQYGVPLMLAEVGAWGLRFSDRWLLQAYTGETGVAVYSAVYAIAEASILVVIAVCQLAIRPMEVRLLESRSKEETAQFASEATRIFLLLAIPVAVFASGLARPIMAIAMPEEYQPGASLVPWIVWAVVLLGLQQRFQVGLISVRRTMPITLAAVFACFVNVGLNIVTLRQFGPIAAAVNTLLAYGVFLVLVAIPSRQFLAWRFPWHTLWKTIGGAAIGLAVVRTILGSGEGNIVMLAMSALIAGSIYAGVLVISGELNLSDFREILGGKVQTMWAQWRPR